MSGRSTLFGFVLVLFSAPLVHGQQIGTGCTAAGGECDTGANLECLDAVGICICIAGYDNDGSGLCAYDCGALVSPTNGQVSTPVGTTVDDIAIYTCSDGYKLSDDTQRTCVDGTGWSGTAPTCERGTIGDNCVLLPTLCNLIAFASCLTTCGCDAGYTANTGDIACTDIDECASNPCQNGAVCNNEINSFSCTCVAGFSDTTCSTNINECSSNPCSNGGTCVDGVNGYTCTCVDGYTDDHCTTDINECASNPCQNVGTCTDQVNGYSCACINGFTDAECTTNIDDCAASPCQNGGVCTDAIASYTCTCAAGYTDSDCQTDINECLSAPCQNFGTCTDGVNGYTCACISGYTGSNCETNIDECDPNPCLNAGLCTDGIAQFTCSCVAGYTDTTCSTNIDECSSTPCQNGGTCFDNINFFTCGCEAGYTDTFCETNINECSSAPCLNGGTCLDAVNSFSCSCVAGYAGVNCQTDIDECSSSPCLNDGVCADAVNEFICTCAPGFTDTNCRASVLGDDCSTRINVCFGLSNAECSVGVCTCLSGYEDLGSGTCTPLDCGALLGPTSGNVDLSSGTVFSNVATFTCNEGYTLSGDTSRTCQADGTWGGTTPICNINDCGALLDPVHGNVDTTGGTAYLSQATYSCDMGYTLNGEIQRICQANSIWTQSTPTCVINDCGSLTEPTNGFISYSANTQYLSVATFTCNEGYTASGGIQRQCQADSTWNNSSPTCVINECPSLTAPTHGSFTLSNQNRYQSVASFICDTGYTPSGSSSSTCQADSTWDTPAPTCVINDCGTLSPIPNGAVNLDDGTTYQSVVTFSCNAGYSLTGTSSRTCQATSIWNNDIPSCEIKNCGTVTSPTQGSVDLSGGTTFGSVITYSCDIGYTLIGDTTRTCQDDGQWSDTAPTCQINDCGTLMAPTDGTVAMDAGTDYESVAVYTCNSGYTLTGFNTSTCEAAGTWSHATPMCVIKDCGDPPSPTSGSTVFDATTYQAEAQYYCDTGYDLIGSATRACGGGGTWEGATPTCLIKDCGVLSDPTSGTVDTTAGTTYGSSASYSCDTGYQLTGVSTRVCAQSGSWSDTAATCIIKTCPQLAEPDHGSFSLSSGNYYQSVATFTCDPGYTLSSTLTRSCTADETWNGSSPTCIINDCGNLPAPTNGVVDLSGGTTYLSAVTFTCNAGYDLSHTDALICQADASWDISSPTCIIKDCGTPPTIANGVGTTASGTSFLDAAAYTCNAGYNLVGSSLRYCISTGTWEVPTPSCEIKDCGTLAQPSDGTISLSGTTYQSTATYGCDLGFDLNGITTRTCSDDGTWSNTEPTCERKDCGSLSNPINGAVDLSGGTVFESVALFSCDTGYDLTGTTSRTCTNTGTWDNTSPACSIKDCGSPASPVNGAVSTSEGTSYGDVAQYTCTTGYQLNGDSSRTCDSDGAWSNTNPTCTVQDCGPLAAPINGDVTYTDGSTTYGSSVVYACNTGYQVNGVATRVCQPDGTWSDAPASCILQDCSVPIDITNGIYTNFEGTTFGAVVTYQCNANYGLVGEATVTCGSDGTWSARPVCIRDCGTPVTITNGDVVTASGTLAGGVASYTCHGGYSMSGTADITCPNEGVWPTEPFCALITTPYNETCATDLQCATVAGMCLNDGNGAYRCMCATTGFFYDASIDTCLLDCGGLTAPTNGEVVLPTITAVGQIATYSCDTGYAISGVSLRTCLSSGQWSDSAPVCISGCPDPGPPTNGYVNATSMVAGSIITYSCMVGYTLVGSRERICLANSQWNGNQPYCYIDCPALPAPDNGHIDLSSGDWQESVATYICDNDYALVGAPTRSCEASGLWSGVAPECIFAVFPDILLVFGSLFGFLVLVDLFIIGVVVYFKYFKKPVYCKDDCEFCKTCKYCRFCRKKAEEVTDFNKLEEMDELDNLNNTLNPVFVSTGNDLRKSRHARIAPEDTTHRSRHIHPPPKKIMSDRKPDRGTYFFRDNKHASLPVKQMQANGPGHTRFKMDPKTSAPIPLPQVPPLITHEHGRRDMKELATHEYKNDKIKHGNYAPSDGPSDREATSLPEEDQFSVDFDNTFGRDTDRGDMKGDMSSRVKKSTPLDDPSQVLKARIHVPAHPDNLQSQEGEGVRMYPEERRKIMKKTVNTYSPQQLTKTS